MTEQTPARRRAFADPNASTPGRERSTAGSTMSHAPHMPTEKKEEEVKFAEMETKLRHLILEVVTPTVMRATKLNNTCEFLGAALERQGTRLGDLYEELEVCKERVDVVTTFKVTLDKFWESQRDIELQLKEFQKATIARFEESEHGAKTTNEKVTNISRNLDRVMEDIDHVNTDITRCQTQVDLGIAKNKEHIEGEVRRVDFDIRQLKELHESFAEEVRGPEDSADIHDISPPSLRRLDMQAKRAIVQLNHVEKELADLRKLDRDVLTVREQQVVNDAQLKQLTTDCRDLSENVERISKEAKDDNTRVTNLMAAYTSEIMQEARISFSEEIRKVNLLAEDMSNFVKETQTSIEKLNTAVAGIGKYVEASTREVHFDLEGLEQMRRRDRIGIEEGLVGLHNRVTNTLEATEQTLKGLEHISSVVGMSLQGQRMAIALDVQDFIDRKEVSPLTYPGRGRGYRREEEEVARAYQPKAVSFQGMNFERPQLLALQEKVVHVAQEALMKGPSMILKPDSQGYRREINPESHPLSLPASAQTELRPLVNRPLSRALNSSRASPMTDGRASMPSMLGRESQSDRAPSLRQTPIDGPGSAMPSPQLPVIGLAETPRRPGTRGLALL